MRVYIINERIRFEMLIESCRRFREEQFEYIKNLLENRAVRIDTMKTHIRMMRDLRAFKRCGRARP